MYEHHCKIRVRYAETDQMGVVYYANYAIYYEVARVETLRALGTTYKAMEDSGVMLPVLELKIKYIRSAKYDDELTIVTTIEEMPNTRIRFTYKSYNADGVLLNVGETTLVFVNMETQRPCQIPAQWAAIFAPHFPEETQVPDRL